jgi:hypothetical protein
MFTSVSPAPNSRISKWIEFDMFARKKSEMGVCWCLIKNNWTMLVKFKWIDVRCCIILDRKADLLNELKFQEKYDAGT